MTKISIDSFDFAFRQNQGGWGTKTKPKKQTATHVFHGKIRQILDEVLKIWGLKMLGRTLLILLLLLYQTERSSE